MTRTISKSMAGILEDLELENEPFVNKNRIEKLARKHKVRSSATLIASRLKKAGWLLPTEQQGVWEFAPAAMAGPFSKNDPLMKIKAFRIANPDTPCYLCMQTAAWALGLADRVPAQKDLAFSEQQKLHVPEGISVYRFSPAVEPAFAKGVPCLAPESIIVHMALKPDHVRSWESAMEWLPDVVYEVKIDELLKELQGRKDSVKKRTGYLLQRMYPDAAEAIMEEIHSKAKVRFGPRQKALRNDEHWGISDTILPFSPKGLERVK